MHPRTVRKTQSLDPFTRDRIAIAGCEKKSCKKVGNFHFLCLVQVMIIYIAVEETLLGFVLASTHAARCKEEAVA